jgi:hypothetical protein
MIFTGEFSFGFDRPAAWNCADFSGLTSVEKQRSDPTAEKCELIRPVFLK